MKIRSRRQSDPPPSHSWLLHSVQGKYKCSGVLSNNLSLALNDDFCFSSSRSFLQRQQVTARLSSKMYRGNLKFGTQKNAVLPSVNTIPMHIFMLVCPIHPPRRKKRCKKKGKSAFQGGSDHFLASILPPTITVEYVLKINYHKPSTLLPFTYHQPLASGQPACSLWPARR